MKLYLCRRLPFFLLLLLAASCASAQAQSGPKIDYRETATLGVEIDNNGAFVSFSVPRQLEDSNAIQEALRQSFSFPLTINPPHEHNPFDDDEEEDVDKSATQSRQTWTYISGNCANPFAVQGMLSSVNIHAAQLSQTLASMGIKSIWVSVTVLKRVPNLNVTGVEPMRIPNFPVYRAKISTDNPAAATFNISFGYSRRDILFKTLPIVAFIIAPLVLVLWKSNSVLKLKDKPAEMWGRYFRFLAQMLSWLWLIWIPVYSWSNVNEILPVALGSVVNSVWRIAGLAIWIGPPALVMWLCHLLSYRVYRNVRGAEWSPSAVMRRAIATATMATLPFLIIILVLSTWRSTRLTGVLTIVALLSLAALFRTIRNSMRWSIYAVTSGELRDRIFELAGRAGVKLKQIYVLPEGKAQLSNAFARSDNAVMLTASLLRHLTKREVNAIMGHEIGHLKEKHPQRKATITVATLLIGNFVAGASAAFIDVQRWGPAMFSLALAGATLVSHFLSRSNERHADAIGIGLTGDPESFISGLAKMSHLNLMPLDEGGTIEFGTHPRTLGRLQDIARTHGIAPERLQALLAGDVESGDHYEIDQASESQAKIFSTSFKQKYFHRITLVYLSTIVLAPVLIALLFSQLRQVGLIAYVEGAIFTYLFFLAIRNFVVGKGFGSIERRMRAQVKARDPQRAEGDGLFVGLAPADEQRRYEQFPFWDVGLLSIAGDRMVYLGQETSFALNRDQIRKVRLDIVEPLFIPRKCVYVDWRDEGSVALHTFYLMLPRCRSVLQSRRRTAALAARIDSWSREAVVNDSSSIRPDESPAPAFGAITSAKPKTRFAPALIVKTVVTLSGFGCLFSLVLRLPLMSACYAIGLMIVVVIVDELPKLFYGPAMNRPPKPPAAYRPGSWIEPNAPASVPE
jgi:Zn-dependent protease with chaperone function